MAFDPVRELGVTPADRRRAWQAIRSFAATWLTPLQPDDGCAADTLDAAEQRLGLRLPVALREAYALLGGRPDLTSRQDQLYPPDKLRLDETGTVLVYRAENQFCAHWGIALAELDRPDPPTVFHCYDFGPHEWRPWLERVSLAVLEIVLSESMFAGWGKVYSAFRSLDATAVGLLEQHFTRLAIPDYPMWAEPDGSPVRWFAGPDVLLRDDGDQVSAIARTPAALDEVRDEMLPGDWTEFVD
jgi:hypothetical protein